MVAKKEEPLKEEVVEKKDDAAKDAQDKKDKGSDQSIFMQGLLLPQRVVVQIADEVAKVVTDRMQKRTVVKKPKKVQLENPIFLDSSAIIDARVFDVIRLGVFTGTFIVLESILGELKNLADSKDDVKKERGRRALRELEELKKQKKVKFKTLKDLQEYPSVDEGLIQQAKKYKGKIITCDYSLGKKARVGNVVSIDMYELANILKTQALPGEEFWVKIIQKGKGSHQGVGYLPDGTMLIVEQGEEYIGKKIKTIISKVIQTDAGRIFFGRIIGEE